MSLPSNVDWHPFGGLLALDRLEDPERRRAVFRGALAELAATIADRRSPAPLEGLDARVLELGMERTIRDGTLAELDWLAPDLAYPAVYAIASALPNGDAKRRLGRLVLAALRGGNASTFVAVATQLVLSSSSKWSHETDMRARVALSLELPLWADPRIDSLALALVSRRELVDDWLRIPATGSLASRRLAARLLERASREAARRAREGDDASALLFETPVVRTAMEQLLADRESLVWRSVAVARGQLSVALPHVYEDILVALDPSLGVTEWRRAAVSLAASAIVRPEQSLRACRELCDSRVAVLDSGIGASIVHGLVRAASGNAGEVSDIIVLSISIGGLEAIEALVEGRRELAEVGSLERAFSHSLEVMRVIEERAAHEDEGKLALIAALRAEIELARAPRDSDSLVAKLDAALAALSTEGVAAAGTHADGLVRGAARVLDELVALDLATREGRLRSFELVRELDVTLLETDACTSLVALEARDERSRLGTAPLADVVDRLFRWLSLHEASDAAENTGDFFLRMRRLRALLHLVDADAGHTDHDADSALARRGPLLHDLLTRVESGAPALRRVLCATSARALDAMVRDGTADAADTIFAISRRLRRAGDVRTLAEAVMAPELETVLGALAVAYEGRDDIPAHGREPSVYVARLRSVARAMPIASSLRVEALRAAMQRCAVSLATLAAVGSIRQLTEVDASNALRSLLEAAVQLTQLERGSARRLGVAECDPLPYLEALAGVPMVAERILNGATGYETLRALVDMPWYEAPLTEPVSAALLGFFVRLGSLPLDGGTTLRLPRHSIAPSESALPAWTPLHRTLGGFFIQRSLGGGSAGSVFVAKRSEDRHDPNAESFALKVPDYDASAARTLTEAQFLTLFREEAAALLALPRHPNIARFVTFDSGAKPKPLLVMELVEGESLEHLLVIGRFSTVRAFEQLDGIASGLEAMHSVGIGHLDLKPSNVIVRRRAGDELEVPVLVDFGLAGRRVRPGCGTAHYGAAEVWYSRPSSAPPAAPADIYAFGCLAFELFTGRTLFDEDDPMDLVSKHASHDGDPEPLLRFSEVPGMKPIADVIASALRYDPNQRAPIGDLRARFAALRPAYEALPWPIAAAPG